MHAPDTRLRLPAIPPSGRVHPADGDRVIWESLAIGEYLAERYPAVWPVDVHERALARSAASEMHAGFAALREELPSIVVADAGVVPSLAAQAEIERVVALGAICRQAIGDDEEGPWLFGRFTCADAMFALVALRFHTHGVVSAGTGRALCRYRPSGHPCASLD